MKAWVLSDEQVYEAFQRELSRRSDLKLIQDKHSVGFESLLVQNSAGEPVWGALLVHPSDTEIFLAVQWIHKTWQLSDFVVFDAVTSLDPEFMGTEDFKLSIPKRCLRSAGRGDLQTGPLLYEELSFSESVQLNLAAQFGDHASLFADPQLNLFSGYGLQHDALFEKTIRETVSCFAWDTVSGEVLRSARRLAIRAGALYVVTPRHEYRLGATDAFLKKVSLIPQVPQGQL